MTISSLTNRVDYIGNGFVTAYDYTFKILDATDLIVLIDGDTPAILGTDYTVTNVGSDQGGLVLLATPLGSGLPLTILRSPVLDQLSHYTPNDLFPASVNENALDKLTSISQALSERLGRCIAFRANSTQHDKPIDDLVGGKFLRVADDAESIQMVDIVTIDSGAIVLPLSIANGGTGAANAGAALFNLTAGNTPLRDIYENDTHAIRRLVNLIGGSTVMDGTAHVGIVLTIGSGSIPTAGTRIKIKARARLEASQVTPFPSLQMFFGSGENGGLVAEFEGNSLSAGILNNTNYVDFDAELVYLGTAMFKGFGRTQMMLVNTGGANPIYGTASNLVSTDPGGNIDIACWLAGGGTVGGTVTWEYLSAEICPV